MSNNKDFKVKNGIQPTSYFEGVGTVVSAAEGFSIPSSSYDSKSFSIGSQEIYPNGLAFKSDGTKMYVSGPQGNDINEYALSTAWDVSTASYTTVFSFSGQTGSPQDVFFKPDGTKLYVVCADTDRVFQYSLSTAWDISTASYDSVSFNVAPQDGSHTGLYFKPDGTKMYTVGYVNDRVYEYNLSTAWDISTASFSQHYSISAQEGIALGLDFSYDGTKFFVVGNNNDTVYQYNLSTPWDVSTASYSNQSFSVASQDTQAYSIRFKPDGTKMYIGGADNTTVYQYSTVLNTASLDLSTGSVFDYTPTSDVQVTLSNPAASGTSSGATLLLSGAGYGGYDLGNAVYSGISFSFEAQDTNMISFAFNDGGSKMYAIGGSIYQYTLSTPFDVGTASYDSVNFSTSAQSASASGLSFNDDGTSMYIIGFDNATAFQYTLSTAYDLSTASYANKSFSVSAQDTQPRDLIFNNTGTKAYVVGRVSDRVFQYSLSTAFDISTASYDNVSFSVTSQDTDPWTSAFNNDGTKLYIVGGTNKAIYQYSLSTAYNLGTISYDNVSLGNVAVPTDSLPRKLKFNTDGSKLYILGFGQGAVYQYFTVTPATITYDPNLQWSAGTAPTAPALGETDVITFNTTDGGTTYTAVQAIDGAA